MFPKCFESQQQYDEWMEADRAMQNHHRASPYCTDCTPSYAQRMRLDGRCEHEEVRFYKYADTWMGITEESRGLLKKTEGNWKLYVPYAEIIGPDV